MNTSTDSTRTCFVLMPFDPGLVNLWDAVIRPAIEQSGLVPIRSDEMGVGGNIMASVRRQIIDAKVVVAVITGNHANVMYELGLAHAAKKKVILLQAQGETQSEAFSNLHCVEYNPADFPFSREAFIKALASCQAAVADDLFPELAIPSMEVMEEYQYLKQTRKTVTVHVTPEECSIFFNNRYLGNSPQTFSVNPDASQDNVLSISAPEHFEYYRVLSERDLDERILTIEMEIRDKDKYPERVRSWLMLRRNDPDNPVLSHAIAKYLIDVGEYDQAKEEALFCISRTPQWFAGYNALGCIEIAKENYNRAISHFNTVTHLNHNNCIGWYNLACTNALAGNNSQALSLLHKIIETKALRKPYRQTYKNQPKILQNDSDFKNLKNSKLKKEREDFANLVQRFDALFQTPPPGIITTPTPTPEKEPPTQALPLALRQFKIENFQCIKSTGIKNLPADAPWIILTGDNGDGKTCLLQALAIGLNGAQDAEHLLRSNPTCQVGVEILTNKQNQVYNFALQDDAWRLSNHQSKAASPLPHLVTYGPARLDMSGKSAKSIEKVDHSAVYSLMSQRGNLRNIEDWLKDRALDAQSEKRDSDNRLRIEHIKHILVRLMPNVTRMERVGSRFRYTENGFEVSASQLSAGQYNILAMIGDLLIRLYESQPGVVKPEALQGIVLIDELDVHLHPIRQKKLPGILSSIFPKIQFIASTHSVIPIMGVPSGSIFLRVKRDALHGTQVDQPDIEIGDLLPNAVLTSPLFNMDSILSKQNKKPEDVHTDDDFAEVQRKREVQKALTQMSEESPILPKSFLDEA